jgi:hypothetical protein
MIEITQEYLMSIADYDPDTGIITRKDRKGSNGSIDAYGYLIIKIKGEQYKAHRLAWLYVHGEFPSNVIDHINGDKLDNRIENLRDVPQAINVRDTKREPNKDTGEVGIWVDNTTKGLIAKYTTSINGKTYRFRELSDATNFRRGMLK